MANTRVISLLLSTVNIISLINGRCTRSPGTTPNIRDVVTGRCEVYQQFVNADTFCSNGHSSRRNCTEVTETFIKSFSHKPKCNVTLGSFDDFLQLTQHADAPNKRLFWSDVYHIVHKYSQGGARMETLEDTMTGYLIDRLRFCAQSADPGMVFGHDCPGFTETSICPWSAEFSFWASASRNFAEHASGEATVMLNASQTPAFNSNSFFATWEAPNLDAKKLSKMNIWLIAVPGQEIKETCSSDSIMTLRKQLKVKNIASSCTDEPTDVLWMLCLDHQHEEKCRRLSSTSTSSHQTTLSFILKWQCLFFYYYLTI